jgi:hypothetical protein
MFGFGLPTNKPYSAPFEIKLRLFRQKIKLSALRRRYLVTSVNLTHG